MFRYDITKSEEALVAIEEISTRLRSSVQHSTQSQIKNCEPRLQLVSMKESFDLKLLSQFYNELMIQNFPLQEERDDLEDWVHCLDPARKTKTQLNKDQPYPSMDVILLVKPGKEPALSLDKNSCSTQRTKILAGVAFEYYKQAQCGLLSYMVVSNKFRRLGIMRNLNPIACHAMQLLHEENNFFAATIANEAKISSPTLKAIFAETNTPEAGDAPPSVIRKRHEILYQLGYRHLKFPYIQPALEENAKSFDEVILLIYFPSGASHIIIETEILRNYVVDFFQSVTGYDNDDYKNEWYYKLVEWFWRENTLTYIAKSLPWEDIKQNMKEQMAKSTVNDSSTNSIKCVSKTTARITTDHNAIEHNKGNMFKSKSEPSLQRKRNHVVVIGAGIAGLVSTVTLAEEYLKTYQKHHEQNHIDKVDQSTHIVPLTITLIEAKPYVGGRIRTVVTKETEAETKINNDRISHPLIFSNDQLLHGQKVDSFASWPVAIGAEFVHGVDSMANQLIEDHEEWLVHETFDLCESFEEYPSLNSFLQRTSFSSLSEEQRKTSHVEIFIDGKCYPIHDHRANRGSEINSIEAEKDNNCRLIRRANHIWQNLQSISEVANSTDEVNNGLKYITDMSLDEFIEDQLSIGEDKISSEEARTVKLILESLFSNTAGSSNEFLGIHETSREEWNWKYTESNFRLEHCFNEFVQYYLHRISQINERATSLNSGIKIDIEMECPVSEIGSQLDAPNKDKKRLNPPIRILTTTGRSFLCDKCIVTVPLGVLKAKKLAFCDTYKIPQKMQEAIDAINMFSGMKAHMLLKVGVDIYRISKRLKTVELLFCPGEIFSQIWLRRNEESVFLSGFCVANCRDRLIQNMTARGKLDKKSKADLAQDLMLNQVQRIFESTDNYETLFVKRSSLTCSAFVLHDWSEDEFTLGIYSSPSVGAGWDEKSHNISIDGDLLPLTCRDYLAKPINDEIWFAGEHANTETCATVQSAMESGARAAKEVNKVLESHSNYFIEYE